ncbi:hypothetical protein FB451DRAFT_1507867 [Mycena latifolia]|nr:hypothetical protein FB451DRAFT_1507867 [Mycena latifolia]
MITYGVDTPLILGVMEIGVFLSLAMFGVVALQGYAYFRTCQSDRAGFKILIGALLFFERCPSVAACHVIYYFTVVLAGVPELDKAANSYAFKLSLTPVFETIIAALVQGFFAYRIRLLSGRRVDNHMHALGCRPQTLMTGNVSKLAARIRREVIRAPPPNPRRAPRPRTPSLAIEVTRRTRVDGVAPSPGLQVPEKAVYNPTPYNLV